MKTTAQSVKSTSSADKLITRALKCLETRLRYGSEPFCHSSDVKSFLQLKLATEKNEVFAVMFLSQNHQLLAFEILFTGTINEAPVYPRTVVQKALEHNAAALIVAHNHPSGNTNPSRGDKELTRNLKSVLDIINVNLLDHFIVTHKDTYSFAEHHLL